MSDLMLQALQAAPGAKSVTELRALTDRPIWGMAGQPTLVQMQWLVDEVRRRGGSPLTATDYEREFQARLRANVPHLANLQAGRTRPEELRVAGALGFLQELSRRGVTCYIASGTDEAAVRLEAAALGLAPWVAEIHGARAAGHEAKRALIDRLTRDPALPAGELAVFGDGRIELELARAAGALAVGVASNETAGGLSAPKRGMLIAAGADVIVPDFREPQALLGYFWPAE